MARTFFLPLQQSGANVLVILALVLTGISGWLFQNAFFEASEKVALHLQEPFTVRFAVDPYIWSPAAPRSLRRRYVVGQAIMVVAAVLWAMVAWTNDVRPLAVILTLMAVGLAGQLIFRSMRSGL